MSERGDIKREFRSRIVDAARRHRPGLASSAARNRLQRTVEMADQVSAGGHVLVVTGGSPVIHVGAPGALSRFSQALWVAFKRAFEPTAPTRIEESRAARRPKIRRRRCDS